MTAWIQRATLPPLHFAFFSPTANEYRTVTAASPSLRVVPRRAGRPLSERLLRLVEAEPLWRETLAKRRRVLGDDHSSTLTSVANLGQLLLELGKLDEAAPLHREAMDRSRRVLGDDHPTTLSTIDNMGRFLQAQGKLFAM